MRIARLRLHRLRIPLAAGAIGAGTALVPLHAGATDFTITPSLRLQPEYDTNPRLLPDNPRDVYGGIATIGSDFTLASPQGSASLTPSISAFRFDHDDTLDREEGEADLHANYLSTATTTLGLDGNYTRDYTLSSELEDTGLTGGSNRRSRQTLMARPSVQMAITEADKVDLDFQYDRSNYESAFDAGGLDLPPFDWDNRRVDLGLSHALGERLSLVGKGYVSEFRSDPFDYTGKTIGGTLGAQVNVTETFEFHLNAGAARSRLTFNAVGADLSQDPLAIERHRRITEAIGDVGFTNKYDTGSVEAGYERLVNPSGRGTQAVLSRVTGRWHQRLSERFDGTVEALWQRRNGQGASSDDPAELNSDYADATAELHYAMTEYWSVGGGYDWRRRFARNQSAQGSAESHAVYVFVAYSGAKFAWPF